MYMETCGTRLHVQSFSNSSMTTSPLLLPLPMMVVWPYCAVALPPHLCHGHNSGSANPPFKNPAYGPATSYIFCISIVLTFF